MNNYIDNIILNGEKRNIIDTKSDHTAFEVIAHDYEIPVGDSSELGGYVSVKLDPQMSHQLTIRSEQLPQDQNIIIDWGDSNFTELSNFSINDLTGGEGDYRYLLTHTYSSNGKYVIRIYGNTYFALIQTDKSTQPNILCRALDVDLPVASHLSNFSSFCRSAKHLINVNVFNCKNFNNNYNNLTNIFRDCSNLRSAVGFTIRNKTLVSYADAFNNCLNLVSTDLYLGNSLGSIARAYSVCRSLEININDLLFYFEPVEGSTIDVAKIFRQCYKLTGIVPANKLWNNTKVNWINTEAAFEKCSDEIRSQVPKSWGGLSEINTRSCYTVLNVYPNSNDINPGDEIEGLGVFNTKVSASHTHKFIIRTELSIDLIKYADVVIDWGDGTKSKISDGINLELIDNSINTDGSTKVIIDSLVSDGYVAGCEMLVSEDSGTKIILSHTYSGEYLNKINTIKIQGDDYFALMSYINEGIYSSMTRRGADKFNLLCGLLDDSKGLTLNSKITNLSSIAAYSLRLISLNFNIWIDNSIKYNLSNSFRVSNNLITVTGLSKVLNNCYNMNNLLDNCSNLTMIDFKLPNSYIPMGNALAACKKLSMDVNDILPEYFMTNSFSLSGIFSNDVELTGTVNGELLWNNKSVYWIKSDNAFNGCIKLTNYNEIPSSWGGLKS